MSPLDKTVLVVEDNDLNMKLFHDLLEAHGYNVLQPAHSTTRLGRYRSTKRLSKVQCL